jgi:hypothetical protein
MVRREAKEASHQRANRVLPFAGAKIEYQDALGIEAMRFALSQHLADEARLAHAGIAANA